MPRLRVLIGESGQASGPNGSNGIVIAPGTSVGAYPQTFNGFSAGRVGVPAAFGVTNRGAATGGVFLGSMLEEAGSTRVFRVTVPTGGTLTNVALIGVVSSGQVHTRRARILDSDGTTVLWPPSALPTTATATELRQVRTDGSVVAIGTADPGVPVTLTGQDFFVDFGAAITGASGQCRLAAIEFDYTEAAPAVSGAVRMMYQLLA